MSIPATRQHVRIDNQHGVFLVVWVDIDGQTADLIPLGEGDAVLTVPFSQIRPLRDTQENGAGI